MIAAALRPLPLRALLLALLLTHAAPARADGCPRRFDDRTTGLPTACVFVGRYNPSCGGEAIALFAGDGTAMVVSLAAASAASPLFMPAQVLSATEGKLVLWNDQLDLAAAESAGQVRLEQDGSRLRVAIAGGALYAGDCRFEEFVGRFAGMAEAAGTPRMQIRTVPQGGGGVLQVAGAR
ncbi:MAG: hypothetical protein SF182_20505 [Deltaproteobacteria bacterium]|nr:hypothetical protein [Deltaproteobacteria bacterium]